MLRHFTFQEFSSHYKEFYRSKEAAWEGEYSLKTIDQSLLDSQTRRIVEDTLYSTCLRCPGATLAEFST